MNSDSSWSHSHSGELKPNIRAGKGEFLQRYIFFVVGASYRIMEQFYFEPLAHSSQPRTMLCESITRAHHENHELEAGIDKILCLAADEGFEDGMIGKMSQSLNIFVSQHPIKGVHQLAVRLNSEHMNQGIAADVVRALGQMKHKQSHNERAYIAECLLYSKSPLARDAGAVALSDLADKHSIPALQRAFEAETIPALKSDIEASLNELIKEIGVVCSQEA